MVVRRRVVEDEGATPRTGGLFNPVPPKVRKVVLPGAEGLVDVLEASEDVFAVVPVGGIPRLGAPMTPRFAVALAMPVGLGDLTVGGEFGASELVAWDASTVGSARGVSLVFSVWGAGGVFSSDMIDTDD